MDIDEILMRSAELSKRLTDTYLIKPDWKSDRLRCANIMCNVAFEHAESLQILTATGNFTSAVGLLRMQYESLVRAIWVLHAASDTKVSKLMSELTQDSARTGDNNMPSLSEMLKKFEGKVPKEVIEMFLEFKEYSWKPLSSYIHGGIHAIDRHNRGYPVLLLIQGLKTSNGLSILVSNVMLIISGDNSKRGEIPVIQQEFADCLPERKYPASKS